MAFRVADAKKALEEADARGANVVHELFDQNGFRAGSIAAYGDTIHTFIERKGREFAPGYKNVAGGMEDGDINFAMVDHVVANVARVRVERRMSHSRFDGREPDDPLCARNDGLEKM